MSMPRVTQGVRFPPSETVDFAIVGSGAAGGIIAKELSTAGFSVVVLEQGPRLTEAQFDHDEFGTFMQGHNRNNQSTQPQTFRATPTDKATPALAADLRPAGRRQQRALHRQLLAAAPERLQRGQRARRRARHGARRLADHLRRARAVLHEGRVGARRVGRAGAVRSAAVAALSDAAAAGEVVGRAARARRASARLHPQPSPMAINSQFYNGRPACQHCGFCLFFMCEFRAKSTSMVTMLPRGRGDRPLRDPAGQLRRPRRDQSRGPGDGRGLLRSRRSGCSCSAPGPWCCAPTAPRRRACCSTPSRRGFRTAWPIRAAWSAST